MDRKAKHRILASFVVSGLVVIMLPLFQDNSELAAEATLIKAPPFPDQTVQVAVQAANATQVTPAQTISETAPQIQALSSPTMANTYAITHPENKKPMAVHLNRGKKIPATEINVANKNKSKQALDDNGLINLKNAVWVVEVGHFTSKTAALRLVNQLRVAGHRAFIETAWGDGMTHVFIGPENKEQHAHSLAEKINKNFHLRTMVLRYQPLAI